MLKRLHLKLNAQGLIDFDSTAVRPLSRSRQKRKRTTRLDETGVLTSKIHMVSDAHGVPLHFTLSGGNVAASPSDCWTVSTSLRA